MIHLPFDLYPYIRPAIFLFDSEIAHHLAVMAIKFGLVPAPILFNDPVLHTRMGSIELSHPIGLGAGFDKQAEIVQQLFELGFSFVEIGGVTPRPQPGNPKPRMFRIEESKAIINRFNFPSIGFDAFLKRLQSWYDRAASGRRRGIVGVNIARGDNCPDDAEAYISGMKKFAPFSRFVTINVSCPNEPNARNLEGRDQLRELLDRVKAAHNELAIKPMLFVKISPDQTPQQAEDIAHVVLASGIDGLIVSNTTATRPGITSPIGQERGGLSGKPLFEMSTKLLATMYKLTEGKLPIIASGGVFTGADAYAKIRAGASLVQVYTAMVYEGPFVVAKILKDLTLLLKRDGFASVSEAVGADVRSK